MPPEVLDAYVEALRTVGNPASTHGHGQRASEMLEEARERIARHLGCDPAEVILNSGGTEAINHALKGLWWARQEGTPKTTVMLAEGEHHATFEAAQWLCDTQGAQLQLLPIDDRGALCPATLRDALHATNPEQVAVASFLWANNEVGTVQPVAALTAVARDAGVPVHVDAVSALGQLPIDFRASGASVMSVAAHKVGGPPGVGALIIDRFATLHPLLHGGSQQRFRAGSQNVAGAVGFAAALDHAYATGFDERVAGLSAKRDRLIAGIRAVVPDAVLRGPDPLHHTPETTRPDSVTRLPGNVHVTIPGTQGDSLVFLLDSVGVSASVGSACQAGVAEISHVLLAMGLDEATAAGALRVTLGFDTSDAEIDEFLGALGQTVDRARRAGLV